MATNLIGFGAHAASGPTTLYDAIVNSGASSNLKLCLDAADSLSYSSGQPWLDRSGGGYDFNRGSTSGSDTSDPTFNGVAGALSSSEYWSFDGGDYFTYDSANETWMNALHKDNALWGMLACVYVPNLASANGLFGTSGISGADGVALRLLNSEKPNINVMNSNVQSLNVTATTALTQSAWNIIGLSLDEAGGSVSFHYLNGSYNTVSASNTFNGAYTSPATNAATYTAQIGAAGNNVGPFESGVRLGALAVWQGVAPSKANFDSIYAKIKGRYGLT